MRYFITLLICCSAATAQYRQLAGSSSSVAGKANSAVHSTSALAGQPVVGSASGGEYGTGSGLGSLLGGTIISLDAPEGPEPLPLEFEFPQNFPNPFNPSTVFRISLPTPEHVRLTIFDRLGREAARVFDGPMGAGAYSIHFEAPASWSSGLYFALLDAGQYRVTRKLALLK